MRLAELQRAVQRHVLDGGPTPEALAAVVEPPADERWRIYVEAYRLRLGEALGVQYPALAARCGSEEFDARIASFVAATPSVYRSIRDYGGELAAFLAATGAGVEDELRAELAGFEWELATAFDADAGTPATVAGLATLAAEEWQELRFRALPCVRRFTTRTNAVAAWRAAKAALAADTAGPVLLPAALRIAPLEWLVVRAGLDTEFRSLPADETEAFDRTVAGVPFGELCGALGERLGDAAALQAATWLKGWLHAALLERV